MSDGRAALLWSGKFPNVAQTRTHSQCYCVTNLSYKLFEMENPNKNKRKTCLSSACQQ